MRQARPLQLRSINFFNTTETDTKLSAATDSFELSKVLFVGWEVSFENRLYKLNSMPGEYYVDAAYIGPDGRMLGSASGYSMGIDESVEGVTFSGRSGKPRGGAFLPGTPTQSTSI